MENKIITPADNVGIASQVLEQWLKERRSESRWRFVRRALTVGGVLFFAILYGVGLAISLGWRAGPSGDVVGVVRIEGEISAGSVASANRIVPALQQAYESRNVKAVVISIDSPGGAPVEAERIYRAIDALKASEIKKPIVAVINNMGASAAYMIALHTDKIYAGQYSLVGSVGAVLTGWDFSKAISRVDVAQRVYASGNLKAMLNPFLPMTPEADAKAKELVQQMGEQFANELKTRRKGKLKENVNYATGEIWSGLEAKQIAIIDEIGTVDQIIKESWGLKSHDFGPSKPQIPFVGAVVEWIHQQIAAISPEEVLRLR